MLPYSNHQRRQKRAENRHFSGESERQSLRVHRLLAGFEDRRESRAANNDSATYRHVKRRCDRAAILGPMSFVGKFLWCHIGYILLFIWLVPGSFACIHLLDNTWKPKPLGERTEKARVVVTARTRQTFKDIRTPVGTYTAEFYVLKVLKGGELLKTLTARAENEEEVIPSQAENGLNALNISNFGDKSMCYSDVSDGEEYILFLTTFEGRASANYIDIFSAAAELTLDNEQLVLDALGWKPWTSWTPCSRSCNLGVQTRKRRCRYDEPDAEQCEGETGESRKCNSFSCLGTVNLIEVLNIARLPTGVTKTAGRQEAFHISDKSSLTAPTKDVFRDTFPTDFSVIAVIRPEEGNDGFLFTISDLHGFVKVGIQVGENPLFVVDEDPLSEDSRGFEMPSFPVDLSDGSWHHLAYSVKGQEVALFLDCDGPYRRLINKKRSEPVGLNTVASLGRTFVERNSYPRYVGDVELLLISDDPEAAEKQCTEATSNTDQLPNHENGAFQTSPTPNIEPTSNIISESLWSGWSSCSVSCGKGVRARVSYCPRGHTCPAKAGAVMTKTCRSKSCHEKCRIVCYNGGMCEKRRRCSCSLGYYGRQCEIVSCYPPCLNGGNCIEPNKCSCLPGYTGTQCELAHCESKCQNGGRCVRPGICACPYGYLPPDCRPVCGTQCYNGGTCVGYNYCRCLPGYSGNLCQNAVCDNGCGNGGKCIAPNTCQCASGYTGKDCSTPICVPPCLNGGTCLFPFYCVCPHGTYGSYCQNFLCSPRCINGGTCIGLNTCICPIGYSGQYCQTADCPVPCVNGGVCVGKNKCQCTRGYQGNQCEARKCRLERSSEPYQKVLRKLDHTRVTYSCGLWGWSVCSRKKPIYRLVYKTFFRTTYRCVY